MLHILLAEIGANNPYQINIEKFAHFFEVFATLNLAYGGTELFESILDTGAERYFENPIKIGKELWQSTFTRLRSFKDSNPNSFLADQLPQNEKDAPIWRSVEITDVNTNRDIDWQASNAVKSYNSINRYWEQYSGKMRKLESTYKTEVSNIRYNYKTIFFASGLFCLVVLLIQGYEQFFSSQQKCLCHACLIFMFPTFFLLLYMFLRISYPKSFSRFDDFVEKKIQCNLRKDGQLARVKVFMFVICFAIIGIVLSQFHFTLSVISLVPNWMSVTLAVIIGLSPCLFYLESMRIYNRRARSLMDGPQSYINESLELQNEFITNHVESLADYS